MLGTKLGQIEAYIAFYFFLIQLLIVVVFRVYNQQAPVIWVPLFFPFIHTYTANNSRPCYGGG
jgi:hypothetical protein